EWTVGLAQAQYHLLDCISLRSSPMKSPDNLLALKSVHNAALAPRLTFIAQPYDPSAQQFAGLAQKQYPCTGTVCASVTEEYVPSQKQ
ncbi:hypothetical protein L195_g045315, partial [Trifolium pratense]